MANMGMTSEPKVSHPSFDGKRKNFKTWWTRYKAFASVAGFAEP